MPARRSAGATQDRSRRYSSLEEIKKAFFPNLHAREQKEAEERESTNGIQEELLRRDQAGGEGN